MRYTPEKIVENGKYYSIPIYQRLFEWSKENIITLLNDLTNAYNNYICSEEYRNKDHSLEEVNDYYIGMLTATKENELVDGQQRFTVMMLLGCVFKDYAPESGWGDFLKDNQVRLQFQSRPLDDAYLKFIINGTKDNTQRYENINMKEGLNTIYKFIEEKEKNEVFKCSDFAKYVYKHLVFFISDLPERYSPIDLNKYFERMNTSGKNLEQHEILKVKLLKWLPENDKYMQLWNLISEVDDPLIRQRTDQSETIESYKIRKESAFNADISMILNGTILNDMNNNDNAKASTIASVKISSTPPSKQKKTERDSHSILRFPQLLLNTLYWMLGNESKVNIDSFFNPANLLTTFSLYLPYDGENVNQEKIKKFITYLLRARLALDICFVKITDYGYSIDMDTKENTKKLEMMESMLYVSSSNYTNYKWFCCLMESTSSGIPSVEKLYNDFKKHDASEHKKIPELKDLCYGEIRYWFWRLDLYIWENRKKLFENKPELLQVADNYVFNKNRSIEHVAPQHPKSDSVFKWEDTDSDKTVMNSFGNLVMISQGLNSKLQNESYEVKYAHVLSYCNKSKTGTIESLKLLMIYKDYKVWDRDSIKKHGEEMYNMLIESFKESYE